MVKEQLFIGANQFNAKAQQGIDYMQEKSLLKIPLDAAGLAAMLKNNNFISKEAKGTFLGKKDDFHTLV